MSEMYSIFITLFIHLASYSATSSPFLSGIESYRAKDFEASREFFIEAYKNNPQDPDTLYNLGLAEKELGLKGYALARWRQAQFMYPLFNKAKDAERLLIEELPVKVLPHSPLFSEQIRDSFLKYLPQWALNAVGSVFLFWALFSTFKYIGYRKRAFLSEITPQLPGISLFVAWLLVPGLLYLSYQQFQIMNQTRATIVTEKAAAYSLPDPESVQLFELFEGLEVIIKRTKDEWAQVSYPGGMTGWIKSDSYLTTNEDKETSNESPVPEPVSEE
jgi:hypothetical protein